MSGLQSTGQFLALSLAIRQNLVSFAVHAGPAMSCSVAKRVYHLDTLAYPCADVLNVVVSVVLDEAEVMEARSFVEDVGAALSAWPLPDSLTAVVKEVCMAA